MGGVGCNLSRLPQGPGGVKVLEGRQIAANHPLSRTNETLQSAPSLALAAAYQMVMEERSLDANSVEVVVVSFGCQEGASHWLQETDCPYDMLLDRDRKMYAAFGLGASLKKVLNFSNMLLYAEYVVDNMEFPRGLPSIQDDMFQLGGDFVLDERGRVLFAHCCQSPIDRPSVEDILSAQ